MIFSVVSSQVLILIGLQVVSSYAQHSNLTIYNGYEVEPHSIPFQAFLLIYYQEGSPELCGGCLISDNYVLTAAHCIDGASYATVYLGVHNRSNPDENVQIFNSTDLYAHADFGFNGSRVVNDIGVIKLPHPVKITAAVQPGKLLSDDEYKTNPNQVGINATESGWGKTGNPGNYSDVLRAGDQIIVDQAHCEVSPVFTSDQFLCIALLNPNHGPESASGDSGGPLFKVTDDGQVILGLVSIGDENYEGDTNVGYYLEWIAEHTDVQF